MVTRKEVIEYYNEIFCIQAVDQGQSDNEARKVARSAAADWLHHVGYSKEKAQKIIKSILEKSNGSR